MLVINDRIAIPEDELQFSYARSGGPGGQNVNKVSSKVFLHWNLAANSSVPAEVMERLRQQQRNRITVDDVLVLQSQSFRDQEKNRQECLEKLRDFLLQATTVPKKRKATKPTRGSKERRLNAKKRRSSLKAMRGKLNSD